MRTMCEDEVSPQLVANPLPHPLASLASHLKSYSGNSCGQNNSNGTAIASRGGTLGIHGFNATKTSLLRMIRWTKMEVKWYPVWAKRWTTVQISQ